MKNYVLIALTVFVLYLLLSLNSNKETINHYQLRVNNLSDSIMYKDSLISNMKLKRDTIRDSIYIDRLIIKRIKEAPITLSDDSLIIQLKKQYNR